MVEPKFAEFHVRLEFSKTKPQWSVAGLTCLASEYKGRASPMLSTWSDPGFSVASIPRSHQQVSPTPLGGARPPMPPTPPHLLGAQDRLPTDEATP